MVGERIVEDLYRSWNLVRNGLQVHSFCSFAYYLWINRVYNYMYRAARPDDSNLFQFSVLSFQYSRHQVHSIESIESETGLCKTKKVYTRNGQLLEIL